MRSNHATSIWQSIDWLTIILYLLLVVAGWFSICGATYSFDIDELFQWGSRPMMQLLWIGLALVLGFAVLMVSSSVFELWAPVFYVAMLLLCLVTIFVAPDIKGSRSWLVMGPIRLQPAEFTKVAAALTLAWQCSKHEFHLQSLTGHLQIMMIILIPVMLILGQSETGSALVFFAFFLALYREGFTGLLMGLGVCAVSYFVGALVLDETLWWVHTTASTFLITNLIIAFTLALIYIYGRRMGRVVFYLGLGAASLQILALIVSSYLWAIDVSYMTLGILGGLLLYTLYLWLIHSGGRSSARYLLIALFGLGSLGFFYSTNYVFDNILEPHQQVRIKISLGIEHDPRGKGYNVEQSKIAIGSGGLTGKGFLEGTQTKLSYVPEQDTDFIFCTVGEEQGFIGSVVLLLVYAFFILRLVGLAERQTTTFGRVYGYCIASVFLFHLFINVGMVMGLIPVIGIPLPFFSYGGSSLWGFSFMLFIFLGIDGRRFNSHL